MRSKNAVNFCSLDENGAGMRVSIFVLFISLLATLTETSHHQEVYKGNSVQSVLTIYKADSFEDHFGL